MGNKMAPSAVISINTGSQVYRLTDKALLSARLAGAIQSSWCPGKSAVWKFRVLVERVQLEVAL